MKNSKNLLNDNIEFSEEWLLKEIFKLYDEQKEKGKVRYVKIKKIDLLN